MPPSNGRGVHANSTTPNANLKGRPKPDDKEFNQVLAKSWGFALGVCAPISGSIFSLFRGRFFHFLGSIFSIFCRHRNTDKPAFLEFPNGRADLPPKNNDCSINVFSPKANISRRTFLELPNRRADIPPKRKKRSKNNSFGGRFFHFFWCSFFDFLCVDFVMLRFSLRGCGSSGSLGRPAPHSSTCQSVPGHIGQFRLGSYGGASVNQTNDESCHHVRTKPFASANNFKHLLPDQ